MIGHGCGGAGEDVDDDAPSVVEHRQLAVDDGGRGPSWRRGGMGGELLGDDHRPPHAGALLRVSCDGRVQLGPTCRQLCVSGLIVDFPR